jgi:Bacterial PH domain
METKWTAAKIGPRLAAGAAYSEPVANQAERAAGPVLEPFAGSSGRYLGYVAAAVGLVLVVLSMLGGVGDNRVLLCFGLVIACVAWVVMIRPTVSAREHGVLLRNMTRDVFVPWSSVERARALQTLRVVTPGATYHGLGVTRSARSMLKEVRGASRATPVFGGARFDSGPPARNQPLHQTGGSYHSYVEARLQDLATVRAQSTAGMRPVVSWALLPVIAVVVTAVCVVGMVI